MNPTYIYIYVEDRQKKTKNKNILPVRYRNKLGRILGLLHTTYTCASMEISKNVEHTNE